MTLHGQEFMIKPGEDDEESESSSPTTCFKAFVSVEEFLAEARLINSGGKPDSAEHKQKSYEWKTCVLHGLFLLGPEIFLSCHDIVELGGNPICKGGP